MFPLLAQILADAAPAGSPLFGNIWLAVVTVIAVLALFLSCVALLGRRLAATHPDEPPRPVAAPVPAPVVPPPPVEAGIPPEITAVIAAAVSAVLGSRARMTSVAVSSTSTPPSVEMLMQQWSMEGRRQIYSSHKVR